MKDICPDLDMLVDLAGKAMEPGALSAHLDVCPSCRSDLAFLRQVHETLKVGAPIPKAWIDETVANLPAPGFSVPETPYWRRLSPSLVTACLAFLTVLMASLVGGLTPGVAPVLAAIGVGAVTAVIDQRIAYCEG